jgi:hypothetical protein
MNNLNLREIHPPMSVTKWMLTQHACNRYVHSVAGTKAHPKGTVDSDEWTCMGQTKVNSGALKGLYIIRGVPWVDVHGTDKVNSGALKGLYIIRGVPWVHGRAWDRQKSIQLHVKALKGLPLHHQGLPRPLPINFLEKLYCSMPS